MESTHKLGMEYIDLRSDTVTKPTPAMREAMAKAVVGDDVYQDDPTVNQLQELAAARLGKEAGLFVPSGTMGNLAGILAHCGRGDEVIMGKRSHTYLHEGGGISSLGGVHSCQIQEQPDGSLALEDVAAAIRADDIHEPVTRLIEIENTHNACGGVFQTPEYIQRLSDFAHERGLIGVLLHQTMYINHAEVIEQIAYKCKHNNAAEQQQYFLTGSFSLSGSCAGEGHKKQQTVAPLPGAPPESSFSQCKYH